MLADSVLDKTCFAWLELVIIIGVSFLGWDNSLLEQDIVVDVPMITFHV